MNLAIHLLASWLVFGLVLITFQTPALASHSLAKHSRTLALFSSLIFLTHPVQTQAVTYIVQRMASLATLFYLASVVFYAKARLERKTSFYVLALFSTYAAMFTKQISFTLPLMLLFYEISFLRKRTSKQTVIASPPRSSGGRGNLGFEIASSSRRGGTPRNDIWVLLPFFISMAVIPLLMGLRNTPQGEDNDFIPAETESISRPEYFLTQLNVVRTYLRLLLLPMNQNLDYDYPLTTAMDLQTLLSLALHAALWLAAFFLYKNYRMISFGILWLYLTLSVESSLIPIKDVIFEHRLYLPVFGFALAISSAGLLFLKNVRTFSFVFTALIFLLSAAAFFRNKIWKDELTLWSDVIKKSPGKARPNNTLGVVYGGLGNFEKAEEYLKKAIQINPRHPMAYFNLGAVYGKQGFVEKEMEYYEKAIEANPSLVKPYGNLGALYGRKGDPSRAIEFLNKALAMDPRYVPAHYNLGVTYAKMGNDAQAEEFFKKALQIQPSHAQARYSLGLVYLNRGNLEGALAEVVKLKNFGSDQSKKGYPFRKCRLRLSD